MSKTIRDEFKLGIVPCKQSVVNDEAYSSITNGIFAQWSISLDTVKVLFRLCFTTKSYYPNRMIEVLDIFQRVHLICMEDKRAEEGIDDHGVRVYTDSWGEYKKAGNIVRSCILDLGRVIFTYNIKKDGE